MTTKELEKQTLKLKSLDKIHLVEKLIKSLDQPDEDIENAWIKESESRFSAYEKGDLKTVPFETAIKKIRRK